MSIIGTDVIRRLVAQGDHWRRRQSRMETMAKYGRVDWTVFGEARAFTEGLVAAYEEALEIIAGTPPGPGTVDPLVLELARQGLSVERIAARCGISERDVAAELIRYVEGTTWAA